MLATFINVLMSAEADAVCGAPCGMPGPERVDVRNGYRLTLLGWPQLLVTGLEELSKRKYRAAAENRADQQ